MLRVYFDTPPDAARAFAWALYDVRGNVTREGQDVLSRLPPSQRREAVLSVILANCLSLALPPMNATRREAAIRLALEDRITMPIQQMRLVLSPSQNNRVLARVVENALLDALRAYKFTRVIAEADLAATSAKGWRCCVAENGKGFVRRDDGSAFAVELIADAPPTELSLALKQAAPPPTTLQLDIPASEMLKQNWQPSFSSTLLIGKTWRWSRADAENYQQAINLLPAVETPRKMASPRWRLALKLTVAALALHIAATGFAWSVALWQQWRIERGWQTLAREAGLSDSSVSIQRDWARTYARLRHDAGVAAPDDALPLLARAMPSLAALPPDALRNAAYADGAWTLEWQISDTMLRQKTEAALKQAGLFVLSGGDATNYRLRIQAQEIAAP
ncbi:MAG: hypothetical protein LBS40_07600 [Burkholderiales bacterium]|jgi:hypothetical protein|nr:hypothetical protein [Burkholderiales bacterium]